MRADDDGAARVAKRGELAVHEGRGGGVEAHGRLVEHQKARAGEKRLCKAEALALALRALAEALAQHDTEPELLDELVDARARDALEAREVAEMLLDGHGVVEAHVLGQVAHVKGRGARRTAEHLEPARSGLEKAEDQLDEGRLACAVVTDEAEKPSRSELEADPVEDGPVAATEDEVVACDGVHLAGSLFFALSVLISCTSGPTGGRTSGWESVTPLPRSISNWLASHLRSAVTGLSIRKRASG